MSTFGPMAYNYNGSYNVDDEDRPCQSCQAYSLKTDWAQGDRVCTNCGVVDEGQLMDTRPEWMSYQDDDGNADRARSGMQAVDESKYLGGLQPTTFSNYIFGGVVMGSGDTTRRKQLIVANKKMDYSMEQQHKKVLELAKMDRLVRLKHGTPADEDEPDSGIRPDHDQLVENTILKEEEDAAHHALYGDKWSLERAMCIHGTASEQTTLLNRDDLLQTMDSVSKDAATQLYQAYSILKEGYTALQLPDRVLQEASHMLVQYATRKDGLRLKGVASRLSESSNIAKDQEDVSEKLRDFNRRKKSSALTCALLYLTARNLGYTRALHEVVNAFSHIKAKHCSKAMAELKLVFPDFTKKFTPPQAGLVEHAARKLDLPPVATACIHILVHHLETSLEKVVSKPSTLCASVAYFVCQAGDTMQGLAEQSQETKYGASPSKKRKLVSTDAHPENDDVKLPAQTSKKRFDVFSDAPIATTTETTDYEMRRLWDAWSEQMTWKRTPSQVEQACGVPRKVLFDFYVSIIHPRRTELLQLLTASATKKGEHGGLADTPRASVLLSNIVTAGPMMTARGGHTL
jgi:transcription initiation factor TFIIIB Brf1 subunit/transcription initiation factor TFIIB